MTDCAAFAKMNGLGNDIIVADMRIAADKFSAQAAINLARSEETAFDQIMVIYDRDRPDVDYYVEIINCDGSLAQACGNGTRCVAKWLYDQTGQTDFVFNTLGGIIAASYKNDDMITVDMGVPRFAASDIPLAINIADISAIDLYAGDSQNPIVKSPALVSMGNPHAIFWVENDVWTYPLEIFGPEVEKHPIFPEKANISIAQIIAPDELNLRTWERGAGLTRACGTAACSAAVSAARLGKTERNVKVNLPGGRLLIEWRDNNHVFMTGAAELEFSGFVDPQTGRWTRDTALTGEAI